MMARLLPSPASQCKSWLKKRPHPPPVLSLTKGLSQRERYLSPFFSHCPVNFLVQAQAFRHGQGQGLTGAVQHLPIPYFYRAIGKGAQGLQQQIRLPPVLRLPDKLEQGKLLLLRCFYLGQVLPVQSLPVRAEFPADN